MIHTSIPDIWTRIKFASTLLTYKEGQKILLYHTAIAVRSTSKLASFWKGPYVIEKGLKDVTLKITEKHSSKQQIVHYDRLKSFFEPPRTSNVPKKINPEVFS